MSYVRPMKINELTQWILERTSLDTLEAETLAQDLIDTFDVITTSDSPVGY